MDLRPPPMETLSSSLSSTIPSSLLLPKTPNPNHSSSTRITLCFSTKRNTTTTTTNSYWDSNAESVRTGKFKFNFDDDDDDDDDDDGEMGFGRRRREEKQKRSWWSDDDDDDEFEFEQGGGILEEAIDSIWIFKVFKAFGWLLPAIIISLLITSGPKAFLMALALPLGQSALSFAIDKVFNKPKARYRPKKKPFSTATSNVEMNDEEDSEERQGYQSWVASDDGSVRKKTEKQSNGPSFGGWDELDKRQGFENSSKRRPPPTMGGVPRTGMRGKLSRRGRSKETPLLLRLLIAVFPFLGSWTKLL